MESLSGQVERRFAEVWVPEFLREAPRLLFFGGSFDPPHEGHVRLPLEVIGRLWPGEAAWLVYVPAARSPHKSKGPAPDADRVEMLRLALKGRRRWWVWDQELRDAALNPGQPSYWADTWAIAGRVFKAKSRAFLIGVDQALAMHRWHRYREFASDAVVMLRGEEISERRFAELMQATGAWTPAEVDEWVLRLVRTPVVDVSSTEVRDALLDPHQRNARVEGLDPGVRRYIVSRGLYAGGVITPWRAP